MSEPSSPRWCLLIHALPARPLYLRARVRRLLGRLGAAPLKKSVYVLPYSEAAVAELGAIADEIRGAGASAFVCEATFTDRTTDRAVMHAYNAELEAGYRSWMKQASAPAAADGAARDRLETLRTKLDALRARDAFEAPGGAEATVLLARLERATRRGSRPSPASALRGLRWVTRKGLHVDRLACAWVVLRFIDAAAAFRFVSSPDLPLSAGEIGFDMPRAAITHEQGRCSVESLVRRAGLKPPAIQRIAEIVHDIDLKDSRYNHAETAGFERLLVGTIASLPDDRDRLNRGLALFDALHASLAGGSALPPLTATAPRVRMPESLRKRRRP